MCRRLAFVLFVMLFCQLRVSAQRVAVYIVAHPDDWQLFMGSQAYNDMQDTNSKVVFIYTTSGDATFRGNLLPNLSFAQAREKGILNSIRFCSDVKSRVDSTCRTKPVIMHDRDVLHYRYKNVENYFLRLPDGCFSAGYHGQSLEYLYKGKINSISAIDSTATYDGWQDVVDMLKYIIHKETDSADEIVLHIQEPEEQLNPGDHPDHRFTGVAALGAVDSMGNIKIYMHVGYDVNKRPVNLKPEEIAVKAGIFAVADFGLTESREGSTFDNLHIGYLMRSYYRVIVRNESWPLNLNGEFLVAPNPVGSDNTHIHFMLPDAEAVNILVFDEAGHCLYHIDGYDGIKGGNDVDLPTAQYSAGNYIVTLQRAAGNSSVRFLKK